jgi:hypothetical protein
MTKSEKPMPNPWRRYNHEISLTPIEIFEWARTRETSMAVAHAIHIIARGARTPEALWNGATQSEIILIVDCAEELIALGDYETGEDLNHDAIHVPTMRL